MKELKITPWSGELGAYTLPAGARERLSPLSLEEQMRLFRTEINGVHVELTRNPDVLSLIVDGGITVGVMLSDDASQPTPCYIGDSVCTWDASDNNGAGYKVRMEYTSLILLEEN